MIHPIKLIAAFTLGAVSAVSFASEPYPSTYKPIASTATLIKNATVLTGTGERLDGADVLLENGKVSAVGKNLTAPEGANSIDASGRWVTPGVIDVHSHLGVYPSPQAAAHADGNEMTNPVTPNVWAEHSVWPQDPAFRTALAGGVTALQILPGSGNLIGGRGVTLKNVPATTYQAMKFPEAKHGLKMACGENPKRFYGAKGTAPMTRMGNVAGYRQAYADALEYKKGWDKYNGAKAKYNPKKSKGDAPTEPKRDLKMETLMGAMNGEILVHIHCYRADEMAVMIDLAKEFGFKIAAFHHAVEAYKIADQLAQENICGALWADWWGFKMEAYDGIQENLAIVDRSKNSCAVVHSDSGEGIQRLNQETAKAMATGKRAGIDIAPEQAIRWITFNAAKALGIEGKTGTLEAGKMADVVIWNQNPFSVYAKADHVYIDGALLHDRSNPQLQPVSDFQLGQEVQP